MKREKQEPTGKAPTSLDRTCRTIVMMMLCLLLRRQIQRKGCVPSVSKKDMLLTGASAALNTQATTILWLELLLLLLLLLRVKSSNWTYLQSSWLGSDNLRHLRGYIGLHSNNLAVTSNTSGRRGTMEFQLAYPDRKSNLEMDRSKRQQL
jgi:hypothetical protein